LRLLDHIIYVLIILTLHLVVDWWACPYSPYICQIVYSYYIIKLQNVLCIYICLQMNKRGMLIMPLIVVTSIGNKTKHTYTLQKIKQASQL